MFHLASLLLLGLPAISIAAELRAEDVPMRKFGKFFFPSAKMDRLRCPDSSGLYPVPGDCHMYIICFDDKPLLRRCPRNKHFVQNVGCARGYECPQEQTFESDSSVCDEANSLQPDPTDCRKYIKCVKWKPIPRVCWPGKAFNPEKKRCTPQQFIKCMRQKPSNNDLLSIMRSQE